MGWRPPSSIVRHALMSSFQELLGQSWPNILHSVCGVGRREVMDFVAPHHRGRGFFCGGRKVDVFLEESSSLLQCIVHV